MCRYSTADRPFSCLKAGFQQASTSTEVDVEFGNAPVAVPLRPGPSPSGCQRHSSPVVHEVGVQPATSDPAYAYLGERRPSAAGSAAYNVSYGRTHERRPSREETVTYGSSRHQPYPPERFSRWHPEAGGHSGQPHASVPASLRPTGAHPLQPIPAAGWSSDCPSAREARAQGMGAWSSIHLSSIQASVASPLAQPRRSPDRCPPLVHTPRYQWLAPL